MRIAELFRKKRAVWSFEVFPPKQQSGMGSVNATLEELKDLAPDYVSVTYRAGGSRNAHTAETLTSFWALTTIIFVIILAVVPIANLVDGKKKEDRT